MQLDVRIAGAGGFPVLAVGRVRVATAGPTFVVLENVPHGSAPRSVEVVATHGGARVQWTDRESVEHLAGCALPVATDEDVVSVSYYESRGGSVGVRSRRILGKDYYDCATLHITGRSWDCRER